MRSIVAPALLSAVLLIASPAIAANASFGNNNVQALIDGGTVSFRAASVINNSKHATGALRLELWAASQPFGVDGAAAPPMNYKLAQFQLGPLQVGQQFRNLISPSLQIGSPPDGTWYYVVFLTEFTRAPTNDGYSADDWLVMPGTVTIGTPSPPPDTIGTAVEYFYYLWGFYFVTADPAEIAALDSGAFDNVWGRTGETFHVWRSATAPGSAPTCRFFSDAFAPRSTHVYTPFPAECAALQANPAWTYEGIAFFVALPDDDGLCPPGTVPLYRAYNNGIGGAPNHRFTINFATLQQMLAAGWSFEGNGNSHVFACVPQ
jgi:hypothetical protein